MSQSMFTSLNGDGEAVINVGDTVELRESVAMKVRELARAQELAEQNRQLIISMVDTARSATYDNGHVKVIMTSGREICFAVTQNPRLKKGTPSQLSRIEISPFGLHWPDLDEDLSYRGLLAGDHGQA